LLRARVARAAEQPLVLISTPTNNSQVWMDRLTPVLVTARGSGIARVELWANGQLLGTELGQEGLTTFSTAFLWQPQQPGPYTLIARAFNTDGDDGQATVAVQAVEDVPPDQPPVPAPEEGVGEPGNSEDPGSGGVGEVTPPAGGEPEATPTGEAPPAGEATPTGEAPPAGEEAPDPDPAGPADESVDLGGAEAEGGNQALLTVEIIGLSTSQMDYHLVNCYLTVAEAETTQVPFEFDGILWQPTGIVSATFPWAADQPLPVRLECTGVRPPAEAIALGEPVENQVPPEEWDGRILRLEWPETYDFLYRILFHSGTTSADIPAPTNLRIEDVPLSPLKMLRWDWAGDEGQIDGFRLYMNDTLQWRVADPSARFTYLPPEWLDPPCGQFYHFQVAAYNGPFPGGVESLPGDLAPIEPQPGHCGGIFRFTLEEITFADLDYAVALPDTVDDDGKVGPLYGFFLFPLVPLDMIPFASLPFDTVQSDGGGVSGIRVEGGEHLVMADTLFGEPYRYHQNSIVFQWDTELPAFQIIAPFVDYDWGEGDDDDDMVCIVDTMLGAVPVVGPGVLSCMYGVTEIATITYLIEELPEWPEGVAPPGAIFGAPRPELFVPYWELDPGGLLHLYAVNGGMAAAVPDVDLAVELGGASLGTFTIPSGDDTANGEWDGWFSDYVMPGGPFPSPADLCSLQVTIDPANEYIEYDEDNTTTAADLDYAWTEGTARPDWITAVVTVDTSYYSCHGTNVGMQVTPLVGGVGATNFTLEVAPVLYGDSTADLSIIYSGADPLTTDGLRLELIDMETNETFFTTEWEEPLEWIP
jgi:hypothetical protein